MIRRLAVALLALALPGCAVLHDPMRAGPQDAGTVPAPAVRAIPSHWQAQGRLAAIRPHEAWNVSFDWRQAGADYRIELQGPFGQGAARIEGTDDRVSLHMADGQTHTAGDPESLLAAQLGWRAPVSALRYWLAGQPSPGLPVSEGQSDAAGRWQAFHQAGWRIEYTEYHHAAAPSLPRRLRLEQDDLSVRIVITAWTL